MILISRRLFAGRPPRLITEAIDSGLLVGIYRAPDWIG
jgi:hypothetical protein